MYAWVDEISARLVKTEKFDGRRRRDVRQIFSFSMNLAENWVDEILNT